MITDEELNKKIEQVSTDFHGQIDDLYQAVGMIVIGRMYGWQVMRLSAPRRIWSKATELFGDPKLLMRPRGVLAYKSLGLKIVDTAGDYWDVVKGKIPTTSDNRKQLL
jgi:hypothetical protein